jgi:hypothetical protein
MKKEHIVPVILTVAVIGIVIFSWQYYQKSQIAATPATPAAPAKTS